MVLVGKHRTVNIVFAGSVYPVKYYTNTPYRSIIAGALMLLGRNRPSSEPDDYRLRVNGMLILRNKDMIHYNGIPSEASIQLEYHASNQPKPVPKRLVSQANRWVACYEDAKNRVHGQKKQYPPIPVPTQPSYPVSLPVFTPSPIPVQTPSPIPVQTPSSIPVQLPIPVSPYTPRQVPGVTPFPTQSSSSPSPVQTPQQRTPPVPHLPNDQPTPPLKQVGEPNSDQPVTLSPSGSLHFSEIPSAPMDPTALVTTIQDPPSVNTTLPILQSSNTLPLPPPMNSLISPVGLPVPPFTSVPDNPVTESPQNSIHQVSGVMPTVNEPFPYIPGVSSGSPDVFPSNTLPTDPEQSSPHPLSTSSVPVNSTLPPKPVVMPYSDPDPSSFQPNSSTVSIITEPMPPLPVSYNDPISPPFISSSYTTEPVSNPPPNTTENIPVSPLTPTYMTVPGYSSRLITQSIPPIPSGVVTGSEFSNPTPQPSSSTNCIHIQGCFGDMTIDMKPEMTVYMVLGEYFQLVGMK